MKRAGGRFKFQTPSSKEVPSSNIQEHGIGRRLSRIGGVGALSFATFLILSAAAQAEEKKDQKEEKKPDPPRIALLVPLAASIGTTNQIKIRGQNLTNVTEVRFTNETVKVEIVIKAKGKAELPKDADAKKVGDTQLEIELTVPAETGPATNWFIVVSPDGQSEPKPLLFLPTASLIEEQEPNGAFRAPQDVAPGRSISGGIREPGDVDVFRFSGKAGQKVTAEVYASAAGSSLDSLLTLYDGTRHFMASNDDSPNTIDAAIRFKLPRDGDYLLVLQDAHDRGGPGHVYLLAIRIEE